MYCDEDGYNSDPDHFRPMVDALVDETLKRGMYALIDWHMLSPGDPMKGFSTLLSKNAARRRRCC